MAAAASPELIFHTRAWVTLRPVHIDTEAQASFIKMGLCGFG